MGDMADLFADFGQDESDFREHTVICPNCKKRMCLTQTSVALQYVCSTCDMVHGAHSTTGAPLGTPADKTTRSARAAAHSAFDPLWKSGRMTRREAYQWLAEQLGITVEQCHFGAFDLEMCNKAIKLCFLKQYTRQK